MDLRNVIFAIALSFAVLFGWSVIFETPEIEKQKQSQQTESKDQSSSTPSVNVESTNIQNISREDSNLPLLLRHFSLSYSNPISFLNFSGTFDIASSTP